MSLKSALNLRAQNSFNTACDTIFEGAILEIRAQERRDTSHVLLWRYCEIYANMYRRIEELIFEKQVNLQDSAWKKTRKHLRRLAQGIRKNVKSVLRDSLHQTKTDLAKFESLYKDIKLVVENIPKNKELTDKSLLLKTTIQNIKTYLDNTTSLVQNISSIQVFSKDQNIDLEKLRKIFSEKDWNLELRKVQSNLLAFVRHISMSFELVYRNVPNFAEVFLEQPSFNFEKNKYLEYFRQIQLLRREYIHKGISTAPQIIDLIKKYKASINEKESINFDDPAEELSKTLKDTHQQQYLYGTALVKKGYDLKDEQIIRIGAYILGKRSDHPSLPDNNSKTTLVHGVSMKPFGESGSWEVYNAALRNTACVSPKEFANRIQSIVSKGLIASKRQDAPLIAGTQEVWVFRKKDLLQSRYGVVNIEFEYSTKSTFTLFKGEKVHAGGGRKQMEVEYYIIAPKPIKVPFKIILLQYSNPTALELIEYQSRRTINFADWYEAVKVELTKLKIPFIEQKIEGKPVSK